jgi:hypothetical protein
MSGAAVIAGPDDTVEIDTILRVALDPQPPVLD